MRIKLPTPNDLLPDVALATAQSQRELSSSILAELHRSWDGQCKSRESGRTWPSVKVSTVGYTDAALEGVKTDLELAGWNVHLSEFFPSSFPGDMHRLRMEHELGVSVETLERPANSAASTFPSPAEVHAQLEARYGPELERQTAFLHAKLTEYTGHKISIPLAEMTHGEPQHPFVRNTLRADLEEAGWEITNGDKAWIVEPQRITPELD